MSRQVQGFNLHQNFEHEEEPHYMQDIQNGYYHSFIEYPYPDYSFSRQPNGPSFQNRVDYSNPVPMSHHYTVYGLGVPPVHLNQQHHIPYLNPDNPTFWCPYFESVPPFYPGNNFNQGENEENNFQKTVLEQEKQDGNLDTEKLEPKERNESLKTRTSEEAFVQEPDDEPPKPTSTSIPNQ